ncbi:MAG: hypothetical protein Q8L86_10070 [Vicinamibacterales bacterium]|nr:hypothetical protein [Vicinamibacterales bacterium]
MRVPAFFPVTVRIDDEEVRFGIKRMTFEEYAWFDAAFKTHSDAGITEDAARAFVADTFDRFVVVQSELVAEESDGSERRITNGKDFLCVYGRYGLVVQELLGKVYLENVLDEEKKRALRSPAGSSASSAAPVGAGPRPETTAAPAGDGDSARTEAATPTMPDASSGSTERSLLDAAPSVN